MSKLLGVVAVVLLTGCDRDAREEILAPETVAGIYVLETVQGKALPATLIEENGYRLEVLAGSYGLAKDGTYTSTLTIRESIETPSTPSVSVYEEKATGAYSLTAQIVRFTDTLGREVIAELVGGTLSFAGSLPRIYRK